MTPTDETILAAARECGFQFDAPGGNYGMVHGFLEDIADLYNAAYAAGQRAGLEAAAVVCDERAKTYGLYSDDVSLNRSLGSEFCADAIRSAIKGDV